MLYPIDNCRREPDSPRQDSLEAGTSGGWRWQGQARESPYPGYDSATLSSVTRDSYLDTNTITRCILELQTKVLQSLISALLGLKDNFMSTSTYHGLRPV